MPGTIKPFSLLIRHQGFRIRSYDDLQIRTVIIAQMDPNGRISKLNADWKHVAQAPRAGKPRGITQGKVMVTNGLPISVATEPQQKK